MTGNGSNPALATWNGYSVTARPRTGLSGRHRGEHRLPVRDQLRGDVDLLERLAEFGQGRLGGLGRAEPDRLGGDRGLHFDQQYHLGQDDDPVDGLAAVVLGAVGDLAEHLGAGQQPQLPADVLLEKVAQVAGEPLLVVASGR